MTLCAYLIITVVRRPRGERVVEIALDAGATGSTVLIGRGSSGSRFMRMIGLGDSDKEIVFTLASPDQTESIVTAIRNSQDICRKVPGICLTIDVSSFTRSGTSKVCFSSGDIDMAAEHTLICVIANSGYAYDITNVARDAGARGATILRARGTANEKDSSFFGITIVPEKEMILIVTVSSDTQPIMDAIRNCPFFSEPGTGIIFCVPVSQFYLLGPREAWK